MNPEAAALIEIVASVIQRRDAALATENVDWKRLFELARRQGVAAVVGYALERNDGLDVPADIRGRFVQEKQRALFVETIRDVELEGVYRDFDANRIRYMPLKGSVSKNWYPSPELRTMTDVDILVDESATSLASGLLKARGFRAVREGRFYDDIFVKPPATTIEIHRRLFEPLSRYARLDEYTWKDARRVDESSFRYETSPEVFFLHHVAHLARHFESSGIDLRFLVDLWLIEKRLAPTFDHAFVDRELDTFRLREFVRNLERLTAVWFDGAASDATLDELGRYVLTGADYRDVSANQLMDRTSKPIGRLQKFAFLWSRLFLSKEAMARRYAVVGRYPFLLPVFWIRHFVDSLLNKETRQKIRGVLHVETERVDAMREFYRRIGFK